MTLLYLLLIVTVDSLKKLDGKVKDIQRQKSSVGRPPSLIVLGQSCKVKAILVNELFHQTHLPVVEASDNESFNWRMVRFKYSKKDQVCFQVYFAVYISTYGDIYACGSN